MRMDRSSIGSVCSIKCWRSGSELDVVGVVVVAKVGFSSKEAKSCSGVNVGGSVVGCAGVTMMVRRWRVRKR